MAEPRSISRRLCWRAAAWLPVLALAVACAATPVRVDVAPEDDAPRVGALGSIASARRPDEAAAYRDGAWDPAYFDTLLPAASLEIEGLRERHRRSGVGVPLVGLRETDPTREPHYPPEGITRPVTAVALPDATGVSAVRLLDPTRHAQVETAEGVQPLAADFTAPYALLLSRTRLERTKVLGALRPAEVDERAGLVLLEPYDPDKIPLLMIHGLVSSPLTWRELTNAVLGDDEIRTRYQVWHAVYPTGIPYLHAAADLRDRLRALRSDLDPDGGDFASDHLVVVAHSKGGLLAKTLVANSGSRLWDAAFTVPPSRLDASPEDRAEMERFLFFERDPTVRRVVFVATPHRGSRLADNPVASLLASAITLPFRSKDPFDRVVSENSELLTPGFRGRNLAGLPTGPRALSDQDPLIGPLADLPIDPAVPFHTIVGEAEPGSSSDGIVEHASSHQQGATSVLVVADDHGVHQSEEAVAEVLRILRAHLEATEGRVAER